MLQKRFDSKRFNFTSGVTYNIFCGFVESAPKLITVGFLIEASISCPSGELEPKVTLLPKSEQKAKSFAEYSG